MNKKHALAFVVASVLATATLNADTITFNVEGHQNSINVWFEGSGQISVPNGTVNANLSDVNLFDFTLYDIEGSQDTRFAYDSYHFDVSDLTQFAGTFDSAGMPESLVFRTNMIDPNNSASGLIVDWTPDSIQPTANVGGVGVNFWPTSQVAPEPVSLALCGLAFVLVGLKRKAFLR